MVELALILPLFLMMLVGIISLGDIALQADSGDTDMAVSGMKEPGGPHSQAS